VVTAGQKNGDYWQVDPGTGKVLWRTTVGPAGLHGGVEWGSATDNKRIYLSQANSNHTPFTLMNGQTTSNGFFAALDAQTGKILWETADPTANETPGAVTVANGVMYATSISGAMFALDGATGKILWSYQGQGSANAGPAVADGTVYWGNGYQNLFYPHGVHGTTFYAFTPGGR
jgi:polyvinyl alcohol dehydrogenase (cytochrome)